MIQKTLAEHKWLIVIVLIFAIAQIFLFSKDIGWDDSVYIGMGKHIFSSGKIGLWEEFRPPLFSFIIGFFWKLGLGIVAYKIFSLLISIFLLIVVYKTTLRLYSKKAAIFASFITAFTPIYFFNSSAILTDIPSTLFALISIFLFLKGKYLISGILSAIAILTRFPQGIVAIVIISVFVYKKRISELKRYLIGLLPLLLIYLISNQVIYGSFLLPLIKANEAIAMSAPWLYSKGYSFYFSSLLKENILLFFSLFGIYFIFKKNEFKKSITIIVTVILFLSYFTLISHKELRYSIAFLPYIALLSSYGITEFLLFIKKIRFEYLSLILILVFSIFATPQYKHYMNHKIEDPTLKEFLIKNKLDGTILTSNPRVAVYTNNKIIPYYSLFESATQIYQENKQNASFIIHDSTAFPCNDEKCIRNKMELFDKISSENKLIYRKGTIYIFSIPS